MSSGGSPYRRHRNDLESGGGSSVGFDEYDGPNNYPFDIVSTKSASVDRLRRWRQAALVLNASRRDRYTLDLKEEEEKKQALAKIRTQVQVVRAAYLFQAAGEKPDGNDPSNPLPPTNSILPSHATMEVPNAAETNGATTSLQKLRIVFYVGYAATSFAGGLPFGGIQQEEEDLEVGATEAEEPNFNRAVAAAVGNSMPTFPGSFVLTLTGLLSLAQIKWQLAPLGFPSPTLHNWYIVCVTSLLTDFAASVAQWMIISAAAGGNQTSVYNIIAELARIACYFLFLLSLAVLLYS